ncbi:hypothetical protein DITRI_Ditri03aG0007500 [Diplodiscus trichospermus]
MASLTSLLTIEKLQPTITDRNEILKKGDKVGFEQGSFVEGILKGLKFADFQLIKYRSPEELDDLFVKGSANSGIAAAFDKTPYMKLFLAQYCGKYTTVEPRFKTDGFGSSLVADVSRAILNVTQVLVSKAFGPVPHCWGGFNISTDHICSNVLVRAKACLVALQL